MIIKARESLRCTGRTTRMYFEIATSRAKNILVVGPSQHAAELFKSGALDMATRLGIHPKFTITAAGAEDEIDTEEFDAIFVDHSVNESKH